jgi:hypothetical protein
VRARDKAAEGAEGGGGGVGGVRCGWDMDKCPEISTDATFVELLTKNTDSPGLGGVGSGRYAREGDTKGGDFRPFKWFGSKRSE